MRKFVMKNGKSFEMNYLNDIAPVVVGRHTKDKPIDEGKLYSREDLKNETIFQYYTNTFDEETNDLKPCVYYYIGAKAVDTKEYKHISEYDSDSPPKKPIIEVILQVEKFKKKFYLEMKNTNCSFFDLIDFAIDDILEKCNEGEDEGVYGSIDFYDDGGWNIDIDINDESDLRSMITSIRLVELVD